jgi:hypothetical protein
MSGRGEWRDRAGAGIAKLRARFPEAFFMLGCRRRPLKIGINADVVAAMAGEMTPREVGAALRRYVSAIDLSRRCEAHGRNRSPGVCPASASLLGQSNAVAPRGKEACAIKRKPRDRRGKCIESSIRNVSQSQGPAAKMRRSGTAP